MNPTSIDVPGLPPANTTYSQVSILGDLVFVSGQIGIDPTTGRLAEGIQAQTRQAIENIDRCLAAAGTSLDKVAKVNLYLANFGMIGAANEIYAQYFKHRPAKTGAGGSAKGNQSRHRQGSSAPRGRSPVAAAAFIIALGCILAVLG